MNKILLINPPETEQSGFSNPPLGLLYLAGTLLKYGFDVRVIDGCLGGWKGVKDEIINFHPDLVGIPCLTPARNSAIAAAKMVKEFDQGIKVVMGGAHATIMYQQMLENYDFVDYIVLGEGEMTLLEIAQGKDPGKINGLAYLANEKVIKTSPRKYVENLDDIPFPAWHLVDLRRYPPREKGIINGIDFSKEPRISVIFSRGCTGSCAFCSTWWIWRGWRRRSPKNMVDELEILNRNYGIKHIVFADDAMTVDREAVIDLCDEILARKLNIAFHITTRPDCVDEIMLQKLSKAGCYKICYGIESGSQKLLDMMGKKNSIQVSKDAIALTKAAGIRVNALMIVGNEGETRETVKETVDFLKETQPDEIGCVGGLWILPGTKLYSDCKKKGIIDDDFWLGDKPYMEYYYEFYPRQLARFRAQVMGYDNLFKKMIYSSKLLYAAASLAKKMAAFHSKIKRSRRHPGYVNYGNMDNIIKGGGKADGKNC